MTLGAGLNRAQASPSDPPSMLTWTSAPVDVDVVGDVALRLDARATAADTAWIATLQDVAPDGTVTDVTAGRLRATMREVDETTSRPGAPVLPCRRAVAVPHRGGRGVPDPACIERPPVRCWPLDPARSHERRPGPGHASDHVLPPRHVGTSSLNTVLSSSRLLLLILGA
jgi:hypothetical protein